MITPAQPISTVIVERSPIIRAGLKHILTTRFRVCAECSDLGEVPETAIPGSEPSIMLIGIDDGEQDLSRIESLKRMHHQLVVIVMADGTGLDGFLAAIDAGADSYVEKHSITTATLVMALDLAVSKAAIVPLALMRALKDRVRDHPVAVAEPILALARQTKQAAALPVPVHVHSDVEFSERERTILWHLMKGAPNKQIARELEIAEATVKVHVKSLLQKIHVKNRTQAAMWAAEHGFSPTNGSGHA